MGRNKPWYCVYSQSRKKKSIQLVSKNFPILFSGVQCVIRTLFCPINLFKIFVVLTVFQISEGIKLWTQWTNYDSFSSSSHLALMGIYAYHQRAWILSEPQPEFLEPLPWLSHCPRSLSPSPLCSWSPFSTAAAEVAGGGRLLEYKICILYFLYLFCTFFCIPLYTYSSIVLHRALSCSVWGCCCGVAYEAFTREVHLLCANASLAAWLLCFQATGLLMHTPENSWGRPKNTRPCYHGKNTNGVPGYLPSA